MRTLGWMIASAVAAASLAGCGADDIDSPGNSGNVTINNPPPAAPPPPPPSTGLAEPAASCPAISDPQGLANSGTIEGPTGTYRVCTLPARINVSTTLNKTAGVLYALGGRVDVGTDLGAVPGATESPVVLTISPGVVIFAQTGTSWLVVNRGNRINAVGTAASPIVFTSRENVLGLNDDASQGQWGGVVLLGRAPTVDCTVAPGATPGSASCERQTEGAVDPAYFGGATPADNSGTIDYVQVRYSGYVLSGNSELQSLTLGGVGSGTTIRHFHSHNSSDDGFENFGGRANMRYVVVTGADDDNVDLDTGYQGTIQYLIAAQKATGGDSMIELDSTNTKEDELPRTHMKLANFTFIHRNASSGNKAAMLFRGKSDATVANGVVTSPIACLRLVGQNILTADPANSKLGPPLFHSVNMQCGAQPFEGDATTAVTTAQIATVFNGGTNNSSAFTSTLSGTYVNGANETAAVAIDPKTLDAAFDTTNYVGAVKDANDTWYAGWTCNSATANFGTTSAACTSIPSLQ
jgi:hypothetical protein